ncbi:IS1 family transposase [Escherichia coli]|uniref:IS1 family transposase n=1 Tax=Escherichia coli TaxID=562 RepID=UPI003EC009FF
MTSSSARKWTNSGAKSRQRWLFYAYDRLRKTVVAHVFGERTMATLGRLSQAGITPYNAPPLTRNNGKHAAGSAGFS